MTRKFAGIFGLPILICLVLGYFLATPDELVSFEVIGAVLFALCIPFLLTYHHPLLIFSWNASLVLFFLPGRPPLWMVLGGVSLLISLLRKVIQPRNPFLNVRAVTLSLLFFGGVVLFTAFVTGGIHLAALGGSQFGGKKYIYIFAAIVSYFALSNQKIPLERSTFYAVMFFASSLTAVVSNLAYMAGTGFYFLYLLFPPEIAVDQAMALEGASNQEMVRIGGLAIGGPGGFSALLASNGIKKLFSWRHFGKFLLLILMTAASLMGGSRSTLIILFLTFGILFFLEGLHRTILFPKLILAVLLLCAALVPFAQKLPFSMQRTLTIFPINVDPLVRQDAKASTEWRLEMWKILPPEIKKHFFIGKGYILNPQDLYIAGILAGQGGQSSLEVAIIAQDYHNGPLSLLIPFGIGGLLTFIWFLIASGRVLYKNYKFGEQALRRINAFLFASFLTRVIYFFLVFGSIGSDLVAFLALVGLSISLNGGMKTRREKPASLPAFPKKAERLKLFPDEIKI